MTVLAVLMVMGCSKKSDSTGDASADVANVADSRAVVPADARPDQARTPDTGRDAPADVSRDTRESEAKGDTGKAPDLKATDGPDALVPDTGAKETASDSKKVDAPSDLPPRNACLNPIIIPTDQPQVDLTVSTIGETHKFDLPCGSDAPDVVLKFTLNEHELVYADTFGANWNTVLHFSKTCPPTPGPDAGAPMPGIVACNDDACGTAQSQAIAVASNPVHYLYLSGANGASGSVTLHFQRAVIGTGLSQQLGPGASSVSGTTDKNTRPPSDLCEASGATDNYWWATCPDYAGGALAASTCTGTAFDTVLALQIPRAKVATCVDDTEPCGRQSKLDAVIPVGAGLNVLSIFGGTYKDAGPYVITYTRP